MNLDEIKGCIDEINITDLNKLKDIILHRKNIIIIGNGGSNAISSHISQDYTKSLGKRAISFSDSSRLTCYINDYGMENAYVKFIEHFVDKDSLVILISSSGNSPNIINAAEYCKNNTIDMIILSGFNTDNNLRKYSNYSLLDFWVNSKDYGVVECTHEIILHSVI
jgi:D-sedoheptulose 7-phosphate isomerase